MSAIQEVAFAKKTPTRSAIGQPVETLGDYTPYLVGGFKYFFILICFKWVETTT